MMFGGSMMLDDDQIFQRQMVLYIDVYRSCPNSKHNDD